MGLDTSHDCWHGAYSSFMRWRTLICQLSGYGDIMSYKGFGGSKPRPDESTDSIWILLSHSDCDGLIKAKDTKKLADRLESLLLNIHDEFWLNRTKQFISGLRSAYKAGEIVEFR